MRIRMVYESERDCMATGNPVIDDAEGRGVAALACAYAGERLSRGRLGAAQHGAVAGRGTPLSLPLLEAPETKEGDERMELWEREGSDVPDEARVGLDASAFSLDEVESRVIRHVVRVDEVRDDNCRRAGHAL